MPLQDSTPALLCKTIKTDTATTDAYALTIPYTGVGYTVRRVTVYNSRLGTTGATANGATASGHTMRLRCRSQSSALV